MGLGLGHCLTTVCVRVVAHSHHGHGISQKGFPRPSRHFDKPGAFQEEEGSGMPGRMILEGSQDCCYNLWLVVLSTRHDDIIFDAPRMFFKAMMSMTIPMLATSCHTSWVSPLSEETPRRFREHAVSSPTSQLTICRVCHHIIMATGSPDTTL